MIRSACGVNRRRNRQRGLPHRKWMLVALTTCSISLPALHRHCRLQAAHQSRCSTMLQRPICWTASQMPQVRCAASCSLLLIWLTRL